MFEKTDNIEVHAFADASSKAISCCFYIRVSSDMCNFKLEFLCGKSRVAPLKTHTIPQLELLSCVMLSEIYTNNILKALPAHSLYAWSDSSVVVSWIVNLKGNWGQWVQTRCDIVRRGVGTKCWRHVPSEDNPADVGSRGTLSNLEDTTWLSGPSFLLYPLEPIAMNIDCVFLDSIDDSADKNVATTLVAQSAERICFEKFTTFSNLILVISFFIFFLNFVKRTNSKSLAEYKNLAIEKVLQYEQYYLLFDLKRLKRHYNVFIDNNLLRVNNKLGNSIMSYNLNFPILLPPNSLVTNLIIMHYHYKVLHGSVTFTLASLREKYWIIKGRQVVKKVLDRCRICRAVSGKPYCYPVEPQLPLDRISGKCFETVGIDYLGHVEVVEGKSYILLNSCAVSRAFHLEPVSNLSVGEFLLAFHRFISRRGFPKKIYSDNATTFKAANRYLNSVSEDTEVSNILQQNQIEWKFSCPRASWYGDFFERMVALVKGFVKKSIYKRIPSRYEFMNLVCQIKFILNNRPISYQTANEVFMPLTPANLLLISGNQSNSPVMLSQLHKNLKTRYDELYNIFHHLYILSLHESHRKKRKQGSVQMAMVGDMCLVMDSTPRREWKVAKIVELVVGKDGQIRRAMVQFREDGDSLCRPVNKLVPLECHD